MPIVIGLAGVALALIALLILYGTEAFGKALAQFFPKHIGVGPFGISPRSWVEAVVNTASLAISWIMGELIRPAVGFVLRPVIAFLGWVNSAEQFIVTAASELQWIVTHAIPEALHAAKLYALAKYHAALTYAHRLYAAALAYTLAKYHAAVHYAHNLYVAAEHYAQRIVDAARSYSLHLYHLATAAIAAAIHTAEVYTRTYTHALTATLQASIDAVRATVTTELAVAERYADTVVADLSRAVQASISTAVAGVITVVDVDAIAGLTAAWPGLIDDIDALAGVIATDLPDIGAAVRAIPRTVPADLAAALTAVGAISIPMLRYMARCGVPNCRNLSRIGRDLQELFSVVEGAGFLALIGYMVTNPGEASREADEVLGPLARGLVGAAKDLIGV